MYLEWRWKAAQATPYLLWVEAAAAMDSYYVLRCHRHIKFISLHSSPSKKCRFSNARMTGGRAPLLSSPLCPIHVVVCLARAVREWLPCMEVQDFKADSRDDDDVRGRASDPDSGDDGVQKG